MPPELIIQTPGEDPAINDQLLPGDGVGDNATTYSAKHNGGGNWIVIDGDGKRVGDFSSTNKSDAEAEALRLADGGEPLVIDQERINDRAPPSRNKPATRHDATKIKRPVMTEHGWLCPEPKPKAED